MRVLRTAALALAVIALTGACSDGGLFEEAGARADKAVDDAGDAVRNAADDPGDSIDEATEDLDGR